MNTAATESSAGWTVNTVVSTASTQPSIIPWVSVSAVDASIASGTQASSETLSCTETFEFS